MTRLILRKLWTWSVLLTGDSRLTLWLEERWEREILRGCL